MIHLPLAIPATPVVTWGSVAPDSAGWIPRTVEAAHKEGIAVWDSVDIGQKSCAVWSFPGYRIFVERIDIEWHVLSQPTEPSGSLASQFFIERTEKPDSSDWRHYLIRRSTPVNPVPALPDRPLVIKPDRPLTILPGESARFFLEIPIWFRLTAGDEGILIFEEPLSVLSNTWFGDPLNGQLCYRLEIRLHQSIGSVDPSAHVAMCPLSLTNDSRQGLPFEKLCLHVENLSVFKGADRLWTNGLNVVFKGPDQATQIQLDSGRPEFGGELVPACSPREPMDSWSIKKTFSMLKYFTEV